MLAVPMVLEMCMESLFGVVDIFWVAKLGKYAMSAAALTEGALTMLFAVAMGLSMGVTAIVARRTGEKRPEGAGLAAVQGIIAAVAISVVVGVIGFYRADSILHLMGAAPEAIVQGAAYTRTIFTGCGSIMLLFLLNAVFRGSGDAATAMRSLWLANAINIVLNPLLIFGVGPFPRLGILGSALGTTIGRSVGVLYQCAALASGGARVHITRQLARFDAEVMKRLIALSTGAFFQYLIPTGSWTALVRMAAEFGAASVAGYALAVRILVFALLPSWGMANAAATLVGQNLGASKPERAEASAWRAGFSNFLFLGGVGLIFLAAAPWLTGLFVQDPEVQASAIRALRLFAAGNIFYGYGMVLTQSFGGAGDTRTPTLLNFVVYWLVQIPLAWVLAFRANLGMTGVLIAVPVAEGLLAAVSVYVFRQGRWKQARV